MVRIKDALYRVTFLATFSILFSSSALGAGLLIPMDGTQSNHLKAYGVTYWALQAPRVYKSEWLLNYRGGSFLILDNPDHVYKQATLMGVTSQIISDSDIEQIHQEIESENMEAIPLERAPKVAVYTPPTNDPWDDAVTLALTYAEIPYETIWDREMLSGKLYEYDWLHLHHEDFTGQHGKFYASFHTQPWYQEKVRKFQEAARQAGYSKIQQHKGAVALEIRNYIDQGGFLFAMCAATDTLDIALAALGVDIIAPEIDGDGITPGFEERLNFDRCLAFQQFQLITNPMVYEFSNIDTSPSPSTPGPRYQADTFELFEFSAKFDPVPTILTQNHVKQVPDFWGRPQRSAKSDQAKSGYPAEFPAAVWQNISMGFWEREHSHFWVGTTLRTRSIRWERRTLI